MDSAARAPTKRSPAVVTALPDANSDQPLCWCKSCSYHFQWKTFWLIRETQWLDNIGGAGARNATSRGALLVTTIPTRCLFGVPPCLPAALGAHLDTGALVSGVH